MLQPDFRDFHLRELFTRLINDYALEAEAKNLTMTFAASDVVVRSDPALLERILRNYLSNAIRYTDRGAINIECAPHAEQVRIEVTDTGVGIAPAPRVSGWVWRSSIADTNIDCGLIDMGLKYECRMYSIPCCDS